MANYHHGATYGSLAYDLDALAREKQLDEAGKLPQKKVRPAQPEVQPVQRRQTAARAAVRPSPVLLLGTVLVVGMVIALMLCYVKLTGISDIPSPAAARYSTSTCPVRTAWRYTPRAARRR